MQQFDQLIIHANLATMSDNGVSYGLISDAAVGINNGQISWIGNTQSLTQQQIEQANTVNVDGKLVTPALIDCHTHLIFAGDRANEFEQRLQGVSYTDIAKQGGGIMHTVNATRAANKDTLLKTAQTRANALLEQGVMTIEVKSGYGLDFENEIKILETARKLDSTTPQKIVTTFLGAHTIPPEYENNSQGYVQLLCKKMIPYIAKHKLADAVDAYCEKIAFSTTEVKEIFEAANRWGMPVKLHAEQLSHSGGTSLVCEFSGLSADHIEYITESDVKKMQEYGVVATLLPYAFYALQETQKPPIEALRSHTIPMAIATDCNPGTSPTTNILQCMHMACTLFGLTPEEAWLGVTRHAAQALGLEDSRGTIEVGKLAQMAIWNTDKPAQIIYWQGSNPLKKLLY